MPGPCDKKDTVTSFLGPHTYKKNSITVERGDFSGIMEKIVKNLEEAEVNLDII